MFVYSVPFPNINVHVACFTSRFMENLQTEVLELEFNEFSRGMPTISEVEFAQIMLRYTILTPEEKSEYMERMRQRIPESKVAIGGGT